MTQTRVADALRAAYWRNKPKPGLPHHADRGNQYCSSVYRALQASYGMQTSMSRKGNCGERAACPRGAMRRQKACIITASPRVSKLGRSSLNISRCFTIAFADMQKSATRHRPSSLANVTPAIKSRHNPNDLPVH